MEGTSDPSFYSSLPKIELHAHLLGSLRQSSLHKKLEKMHGAEEAARLMKLAHITGIDTQRTMTEQMQMFDIARSAFSTPEDKKQLAIEYIEDCAKGNVIYLELRTGGAEDDKFLSMFAAFDEAAHRQLPIVPRLISSVQRSWTFARAEKSIKLALQYRNRGVVGVDLCGDPTSGDFRRFQSLFQYAQREGMRFTCHFAESRAESDLQAILDCNPDRLGHCCFMHEHEALQRQVFERRIPIETCIASNINTMRLTLGVADHPLQKWLRRKHPIVLCTDNEGLLGSTLSQHYAMLAPHLSRGQIFDLAESSVEHVFAGEEVKSELRSIYNIARSKLLSNNEPKDA